MNPSAVLHADKPERTSAAVHRVAMVAMGEGKCILLSAPLVAKIHRCLSSQEKGDPCTVATVTLKIRARLTFRNTE